VSALHSLAQARSSSGVSLRGVRVGREVLADHDRWGRERSAEFELPACPWAGCWEAPAGIPPAPALCLAHASKLRPRRGACAWPRCGYSPMGELLCGYHAKLAAGLIDPAGHDEARQQVLSEVGRSGGPRRSDGEAHYRTGHHATARDLLLRKLQLAEDA